MKRHENIHTNEKRYECKTCQKSFKFLQNLKRHEKIHNGDKKFECKTCGKKFIQSNELKSHEIKHISKIFNKLFVVGQRIDM